MASSHKYKNTPFLDWWSGAYKGRDMSLFSHLEVAQGAWDAAVLWLQGNPGKRVQLRETVRRWNRVAVAHGQEQMKSYISVVVLLQTVCRECRNGEVVEEAFRLYFDSLLGGVRGSFVDFFRRRAGFLRKANDLVMSRRKEVGRDVVAKVIPSLVKLAQERKAAE